MSILETRECKFLQTVEQRMRVLVSSWILNKILRIKSSGSFLKLSANLSDLLTVMLGLWDCLADLDLLIVLKMRPLGFYGREQEEDLEIRFWLTRVLTC